MIFQKHREQEGQGLVEYALILVLVAIVVIAVLVLMGPTIGNVFSTVVTELRSVVGGEEEGGSSTMHVANMSFSLSGYCNFGTCNVTGAQARVRVVDQNGDPVDGALVSVTFRFLDHSRSGNASGYTGGGGWTSFLSPGPPLGWESSGPPNGVQVCVTGVSAAGYSYDSGSNSVTCTSSGY